MKEKPDYAGVCLFIAATIALFALLFVTDQSRANDLTQDQFQIQNAVANGGDTLQEVTVNVAPLDVGGLASGLSALASNEAPVNNITTGVSLNAPKNAPNVYTGAVYSTAPCRIGVGGGGSTVGAGVSVQLGLKDKGCELRNVSALFHQYGEVGYALALLCTSEAIPAELLDVCPKESSVTEYARRATEIIRQEASK